ncbi:unnamed protein product, partial [Laminaria digitata]
MTVTTEAKDDRVDVGTPSQGEAAARREGQGRNKATAVTPPSASPATRPAASSSTAGAAAGGAAAAANGRAAGSQHPSNRGARLRARLGSGELLLQETPDGLIMSPALHRRRMLTGLTALQGLAALQSD